MKAELAPPRAAPLRIEEFAAAMQRFSPFEAAPHLAVAVSGGADSLALALLAHDWVRACGGAVTALTVDHGLRAASAEEAVRVGSWLGARGIAHHVLRWEGDKPSTGIQAAARAARRDLLTGYCRDHRILHLLLGHQRDDQAETLLLREAAGSGPDGLAGMSPCVEDEGVRLLRPLLRIEHARLCATLAALDQDWIEDPSNRDPRFARSALRGESNDAAAIAVRADEAAARRREREAAVAALLARTVAIHPEGWATLDDRALCAAPAEIGRRALARVLMAVGSGEYAPRSERLERLYDALAASDLAGGRTLAGCRVLPRQGRLLVVREPAAVGPPVAVTGPGVYPWDGRFVLRIAGSAVPLGTSVQALGTTGWRTVTEEDKSLRHLPIPAAVRVTLPVLCDLDGVLLVPHLSYRRQDVDPDSVRVLFAGFRPRHGLAGAGFAVPPPSTC